MKKRFTKELMAVALVMLMGSGVFAQKTFNYSQGPNFNDWFDPGNWTPFGVPTASDDVVIPGSCCWTTLVGAAAGNLAECNNLTIGPGEFAVIRTLHVHGNLVMNNAAGNFYIAHQATEGSVIIDGTATNNGPGVMVLNQPAGASTIGYRHWGSVVKNGTLADLDLATNGFTVVGPDGWNCNFNTPNPADYPNVQRLVESFTASGWYHGWRGFTNPGTPIASGTGLAFRTDVNQPVGTDWISTSGRIWNSGTITVPGSNAGLGWQLYANPYPSTYDLAEGLNTNAGYSTAYLFRGTTQYGGIWGTVNAAGVTTGGAPRNIAPGQGFMANGAGASYAFRTAQCVNAQGYLYKTTSVDNLVRIKLSNGTDWNDMVAYSSNDANYEGSEPFLASSDLNAFFTKNNTDYVINNLDEINAQTEMPVSFMVNAAGTYTVSLTENETNGLTVFLKDNQTNTYTNLTSGSATISLPANTKVTGRYSVTFANTVTGIQNLTANTNIYIFDGILNVNLADANKASVHVYDLSGRIVAAYTTAGEKSAFDATDFPKGCLVVKVTEGNNVTVAKVVKN